LDAQSMLRSIMTSLAPTASIPAQNYANQYAQPVQQQHYVQQPYQQYQQPQYQQNTYGGYPHAPPQQYRPQEGYAPYGHR
jgi:hypothetical protein